VRITKHGFIQFYFIKISFNCFFVLKVPFCFIEDDLIESLKINKSDLNNFNLVVDPNLFNTKLTSINSSESLGLLNYNYLNDYNFVKNDVFSGIDWIYSFVESTYAYNFRVFYYKYYNTFFDDSCDYFYNLF
jgi:hypothetical protein